MNSLIPLCVLAFVCSNSLAQENPKIKPLGENYPSFDSADLEAMFQKVSNSGRWGETDQLGALNLVSPEKRKAAARLVKDGLSLSLARPIDASRDEATVLAGGGRKIYANAWSTPIHGSQTHLDALCHMPYRGKLYNRFPANDPSAPLAIKLTAQGFVSRGILLDIPLLKGPGYKPGPILSKDLEDWERQTGIVVSAGDFVLVRTGAHIGHAARAGLHATCAEWFKNHDVSLVGTDAGLEIYPAYTEAHGYPLHVLLLDAMGVYVVDGGAFEELARVCQERKRWEFLLVIAPIGIPDGTGSPVNPIAVF